MWQKCLRLICMTMSADKSDSHDLSLKQAKYSASKHARYCILFDQRHNVHIILARPVRGEKFNRSGLLPFLKSSAWPSRELILGRIMAAGEPRGDFIRLGTRTTSQNGGFKVPYFRVSLPLFPLPCLLILDPPGPRSFALPSSRANRFTLQDLRLPYTRSTGANMFARARIVSRWRSSSI